MTRRSLAVFSAILLGATACTSAATTRDAMTKTAPDVDPPPKIQPVDEPSVAQRAWCDYLEALYLRAANGAATWPRYGQCNEVRTTASPRMLKRTAECSLKALHSFTGDPFTPEYALQVRSCGNDAMDAVRASGDDLKPYVATICGRIGKCGELDVSACQDTIARGLGDHLGRTLGAINDEGRAELGACFKSLSCEEIGSQINACIEPLMDKLLWLPG